MTLDQLDRLFFEYLRLELVAQGALPDQTDPSITTQAQYDAARNELPAGTLIDLFGQGSKDAKENIVKDRVTIERTSKQSGSIGMAGTSIYQDAVQDGKFDKVANPDATKNYHYEIRTMCFSVENDRLMDNVMEYVFGERRYMLVINSDGTQSDEYALIEFKGATNASARGDIKEMVYRYEVVDVIISRDRFLQRNIVPLTTINYSIYLNLSLDSSKQADAKDIVTDNTIPQ